MTFTCHHWQLARPGQRSNVEMEMEPAPSGDREISPPPTKVQKLDTASLLLASGGKRENDDVIEVVDGCFATQPLPGLDQFSLDRVLFEDPKAKSIAVAGHFAEPNFTHTAVIVAEKTPLSAASLEKLFSTEANVSTNTRNNIYSQLTASCGGGVGDLRLMTVYPATEAHIAKYSQQTCHMIHETPEDYATLTKPFIDSQSFDIQWVYNILEGREEQDRVVYQDPHPDTGFVLLPDFKWDQKDLQNLYLLAICRRRDVTSLRDLGKEHLPLLKNILQKGQEAIHQKYGIPGDQLRVYIHYQPSYYHLHIHFTMLVYTAPRSSVGDAHLLHEVIDNIERIDADYYQKSRLSFTVKESSLLWKAYQTHALDSKTLNKGL